jgi:gamma-glutamyltranspeptidase/glutathione hydrolase
MDNHIIAAGDKATAEAAAEILWLGGNAFDAAVGAVFASMTSEPVLTGPGGAGHFMACRSGEKPVLFDFFADMPGTNPDETDLDFFDIEVDFGAEQQQFHIGKGSVAIPGTVAGLFHVQEQLGYLGIKDVMAPAIRIAKEGTTLSDVQAYLIDILSPILVQDREGADLYAPGGKLIQGGDRFAIPPLSDLLDGLSQEGPDLMYRGEVADRIVELIGDGGLLSKEDLSSYEVKERWPLATDFLGHKVHLNPPPAMSGILIDFTLALLNRAAASGKDITLADAALAHTLTNNARQEKLADGVVVASRKKLSLDSDFPQFVDSLIRRDIGGTGADPLSHGSTTQVSILDREGNAASVTTTNGEGCGYMVPGLGFMLNNMLGEEDLNPKGFHRHRPRSRLPSMVAPTIVTKNGTPVLLTGSAGSNRIRSAIVQMIVEVIEGGVEIEAATIAPRLHIDGDTLQAEPGADEAVLEQLSSFYKIHRWDEKNLYFGGANSVTPAGGAGDPRRGGHAMVV